MKTIASIKKTAIFAICAMLAVVMSLALIPASAEDGIQTATFEEQVEAAIKDGSVLELNSDASFKIEPYEKLVVKTNGYALSVSTSRGYKVTTIDMGDGETVTVYAYKELGDKLSTMNISLSGNITMMFYFTELPEMADTDYFEVKVPTKSGSYNVKKVYRSDFEDVGSRHLLKISVAAAQQTDKVSFQLIKNGGADKGRLRMYSVRDYADKVLDFAAQYNPETPEVNEDKKVYHEMKNAVTTMLNYGAQAQIEFGYNTNNLANEGIYQSADENPINGMTVDHLYGAEEYNVVKDENKGVIDFIDTTAILENTVALHFNFKYNGDREGYIKATVQREEMDEPVDTQIKKIGDTYYVGISNIPADYFDKMYTVTIELDGKTTQIKYSVLSYVLGALDENSPLDDNTKNAARSMYLYYTWMKQYITRNDKDEHGNSTAHVPGPKECTHTREQTVITKAANCVTEGLATVSCADCGKDIRTETIGVSGSHDFVSHAAVAATCSTYGREAYQTCKLCGQLADANGASINAVPVIDPNEIHGELVTVDAVEATCSSYGHEAYQKCEDCDAYFDGESYSDEIPTSIFVLNTGNHTKVTTVAAKTATCIADGWDTYEKCEDCGVILTENGKVPTTTASHSFTVIEATESTCTLSGHGEYKVCSSCEQLFNMSDMVISRYPVTAIDPNNHKNATNYPFKLSTTKEQGNEEYTHCEDCNKFWSADGTVYDEAPLFEILVPTTNKYFGVAELKDLKVFGSDGSLFKAPQASADRSYVRFERGGKSSDGNIVLISENKDVTGQYLAIKYRTNHIESLQIWANTTETENDNGNANFIKPIVADENWHLLILDLSSSLSTYVKQNNGTYTIQWSRIDILDSVATSGYIDLAYVAYLSNPADLAGVLQKDDAKICTHVKATIPEFTDCGDKHSTPCVICGTELFFNHSSKGAYTWNTDSKTYIFECNCGATIEQDMLYVSEPYYAGAIKSFTAEAMDGFVRYTSTGTTDPYVHVYAYGEDISGNYAIVKYRTFKNGFTWGNSFVGSIMGVHKGAASNSCCSNSGKGKDGTLTGDGQWHYTIIEAKSQCFVANSDGTYSFGFLRLGLRNFSVGDYIDVDEVAFVDSLEAANGYIYKNSAGGSANTVTTVTENSATFQIPAGYTYYFKAAKNGMILTLSGNAEVTHNGQTYTATDNLLVIRECFSDGDTAALYEVKNLGSEKTSFTVNFFAKEDCSHDVCGDWEYYIVDPNRPGLATDGRPCLICGDTDTRPAQIRYNTDSFLAFVNGANRKNNGTFGGTNSISVIKGVYAQLSGIYEFGGWVGIRGSLGDHYVIRVLDENGNVISDGWEETSLTLGDPLTEKDEIWKHVNPVFGEGNSDPRRVTLPNIDVSEWINYANGAPITIEIGAIAADAPEENNIIHYITLQNVYKGCWHAETSWQPIIEDGKLCETIDCTICGVKETREVKYAFSIDNVRINGNNYSRDTYLKDTAAYNKDVLSIGIGGWLACNGSVKRYVYRVTGEDGVVSAWITASGNNKTWNISSTATASNNAYVSAIENSGHILSDYTRKVGFTDGIDTADLQDYVGQSVTVEFGFVPENNAGTEDAPNVVTFYTLKNVGGEDGIICNHTRNTNTWTINENDPIHENSECSVCGSECTRFITATDEGLDIFTPEFFANNNVSGNTKVELKTDENGITYAHYEVIKTFTSENNLYIFSNNLHTNVGNCIAMLYRTTSSAVATEWFVRGDSASLGNTHKTNPSIDKTGEWRLLIITNNSTWNSTTGINTLRIDMFNSYEAGHPVGAYIDIAYLGFFSHERAAWDYYAKFTDAHNGQNDWCAHNRNSYIYDWNSTTKEYTMTCACGKDMGTSDMIYKTEPISNGANGFTSSKQDGGIMRYTATGASGTDFYVHIYRNGKTVTGDAMVIKYRLVNAGKNASLRSFFAGTTAGGYDGAKGGTVSDSSMFKSSSSFIGDGEWHYMVITANKTANKAFKPNADGSYTWAYLRIGFNPAKFDGSCYLEIDEIAFADTNAAEYYAYKNEAVKPSPVFTVNYDVGNCTIDGQKTVISSALRKDDITAPIVIDLAGKTLTKPTSLKMGGWLCIRGGVQSFKIRVTKSNGATIENPVLANWVTARERGDIFNAVGNGKGYGDNCKYAGMDSTIIDLTAYAGQTVDFEIVAITRFGQEVVITTVTNVAVPEVPAN